MVKTYKWLNKEKSRYYTVTVQKNGILNFRWGSCNSNRGGKKDILAKTEEEAQGLIHNMMKRRKSRGYELVAS